MAISCKERRNRNLTLILSILLIIANTTCAFALQYLPSSPFNLAFNFALYCSFNAVLSVLGLIGVLQRNTTLLLIFSHHLLLDTLISTLPRLLLLFVSFSLPSSLCHNLSLTITSLTTTSLTTGSEPSDTLAARDMDMIGDLWSPRSCVRALWVVEGALVVLILGLTGVQWVMAWRVRECARWCEMVEERGRERCSRRESVGVALVVEKSAEEKV